MPKSLNQQTKDEITTIVMKKYGHLFSKYTHAWLKDLISFVVDQAALHFNAEAWLLIDKDEDHIRFTGEEITEEDIED